MTQWPVTWSPKPRISLYLPHHLEVVKRSTNPLPALDLLSLNDPLTTWNVCIFSRLAPLVMETTKWAGRILRDVLVPRLSHCDSQGSNSRPLRPNRRVVRFCLSLVLTTYCCESTEHHSHAVTTRIISAANSSSKRYAHQLNRYECDSRRWPGCHPMKQCSSPQFPSQTPQK